MDQDLVVLLYLFIHPAEQVCQFVQRWRLLVGYGQVVDLEVGFFLDLVQVVTFGTKIDNCPYPGSEYILKVTLLPWSIPHGYQLGYPF